VHKDLPFVETALHTDRRVMSMDSTVRGHLCELARQAEALRKILWLNPEQLDGVQWIKDGAPARPDALLTPID